MLFQIEPKKRLGDFFNYRIQYQELNAAIKRGDRIVALKGVRRVGKTSLMYVVYNEIELPKFFIDGRIIKKGTDVIREIALFAEEKEIFKSLKGVEVGTLGVSLGFERKGGFDIREIEKKIKNMKHLYVFIDEAQNIKGLSDVIAHFYDSLDNISFILSGSEVGLLDELLGESEDSPLYGRAVTVVEMNRMTRDMSIEFLKNGFNELKIRPPDNLDKVVDIFDGIIGWLTLYGYYAGVTKTKTSLFEIEETAKKIVKKEIEKFMSKRKQGRKRYATILKYCDGLSWEEIRVLIGKREKKIINPKTISKYLKELIKYGFIEKKHEKYWVADPLIRKALA